MDLLDMRVLHALFLDGRVPLSRIAAVLDVSDQAVARSYRRLQRGYGVRVAGRLNPRPLGQLEWIVRLRCMPQFALAVARALARRPNTRRVRLVSGGTEIVCNVALDDEQDAETLLLTRLPHAGGVTAIDAHRVLHVFGGGPITWPGPWNLLSAEQSAHLRPPPPDRLPSGRAPSDPAVPGPAVPGSPPDPASPDPPQSGPARSGPPPPDPASSDPPPPDGYRLDAQDHLLASLLATDGRASSAALAAATGWHESTVRRRLAALRAAGALYFVVDFDERALGLTCGVAMWLAVHPADLAAVGTELAGHREIPFVAATTGAHNIHAAVLCADDHAFYDYLTTQIGTLPGIGGITTTPIIRTVKRSTAVD